ncbi:MAG: TRAP transporter substrate-binding protein DctP [Gammaproteobacteria bacterium]|nr:TRAP transporter substrate-binding protein DctP [Gammaproteobacteria bacterium]MBU1442999.1 TRAP transporter substrate-binding protein DctP [Gammaproteobacteria bacterium]MBU2286963.1 TRAP transporter substrate-binding protein DctP [Gammaproteobacteria bacterium]MBU2410139.1 TRAP transporter substrate-binding protein DctP [Gammaproteobacteria bacterium]
MARQTPLDRRGFMRIAGTYGLSSTAFAVAGMVGPLTLEGVGRAAAQTADKRSGAAVKTLKFGASGFNEANLKIQESGQLWFAHELEKRSDGALKVEFIGSNAICNQLDCVKKAQQGIVDLFTASTQNSAGSAPYYNVLDFAYMFPSRASQHHFLYSNKSEALLREPMRKLHNIQFLYSHCELRGLMMGKKFEDKPLITSVEQLAGTKNRVTGTQLGRIAMTLMNLNPVPIAWEETLDGLKQGLIDGAETWMGAAAYANMSPVLSQAVDLKFFCGTEHTAMNYATFGKLPAKLQDVVMETSFAAQQYTQQNQEKALVDVVGAVPNPKPDTLFAKSKVRVATLSDAEIMKAQKLCSPEFNPKPWEEWRERLNKMSGGHDVYKEIYAVAREIPADMKATDVKPRRWWQA